MKTSRLVPDHTQSAVATLAIVGRPNVGKSTLFNRMIGRRRAIVTDEPGITRDRLYGELEWSGRRLRVVDTGGIIPEDKDLIPAEIFRQARVALEEADVIVMVVDARTELAAPDIDLARLLIRSGKTVFLAVNKIDSQKMEPQAEEFRRLGIGNVFAVSAEHGNGVAELLDAVMEALPPEEKAAVEKPEIAAEPEFDVPEEEDAGEGFHPRAAPRETRIAIIGRPNVGKSTLL